MKVTEIKETQGKPEDASFEDTLSWRLLRFGVVVAALLLFLAFTLL